MSTEHNFTAKRGAKAACENCEASSSPCMVLSFPRLQALASNTAYRELTQTAQPLHRRAEWPAIMALLNRVGHGGVPEDMDLKDNTRAYGDLRLHGAPVVGERGTEAVYVWLDGPSLASEEVRAAARETVEAKSRFLASASHDLRQPFQAMRFFHSVLDTHLTDPMARRAYEMLERALLSGEQLLNALLDISTLDADIVKVAPKVFDVTVLTHRVAEEFAAQAAAKGLSFRVRGPVTMVESDPVLLERIIRNFLANAVHYTRTGGVLVGVRREGGYARLEVWDTGFGIPEEQMPRIFEEFHQLENPERDRSRGLGLGLAIVRRLARLLGAPVKVNSRLGRGSVFSILLPLAERPAKPDVDDSGEQTMDMEPRTILVVEDDAMVLMGLQMILETWGLTVLPAEDMSQVLQRLDEARPDLILSDLRLRAGLTGFEVVERTRALMGNEIPAIILTGETGKGELAEGQRRNLTFLHKPIQADPLKAAIRKAAEAG